SSWQSLAHQLRQIFWPFHALSQHPFPAEKLRDRLRFHRFASWPIISRHLAKTVKPMRSPVPTMDLNCNGESHASSNCGFDVYRIDRISVALGATATCIQPSTHSIKCSNTNDS